jgi:tRNA U34 5-carboxymethylaminomethyl modifying enzyme MnmG/GidA
MDRKVKRLGTIRYKTKKVIRALISLFLLKLQVYTTVVNGVLSQFCPEIKQKLSVTFADTLPIYGYDYY